MPTHFNAFITPLKKGTNLIEASAGTGKTYSIAMLILRFVVENQFELEKLLVVTFTKAATQELRDRIRARLAEAKQLFAEYNQHKHPVTSSDSNLLAWAKGIEDKVAAVKSLELALADIDHANIFTIHSFCQGVLRHHALEGGQLFDSALADNVDELQQQIAEDYWRQHVYQRSFREVGLLRASFMTPAALLASVKKLPMNSMVYPQGLVLDDCLTKLIANLPLLSTLNNELFVPLTTSINNDPSKFKKDFLTNVETHSQELSAWLNDARTNFSMAALQTFSYTGITEKGLNGNKFKKTKALSSEERKEEFLSEQGINTQAIDALQKSIETIQLAFRLGLHHFLKTEMEKRQQRENIMSFDDLILRLSHALQGEKGTELREVLQQQYRAALIDEFQDTDQEQWHIFSTLFSSPHHYLYLIGDPKQAIYKFRGADIYSYLGAQQRADRDYSLDTNWRSHRHVIAACNHLFDVDDPFKIHAIRYQAVNAGKQGDYLLQPKQALQKLVLWQLDENPDTKTGYWTSGKAKTVICQHTVQEITKLLTANPEISINTESNTNTKSNTTLNPRDIAILVRGNQDALMYQQALQTQGIPAVLNARTSVFSTHEAVQLFHLLDAIAEPSNRQKLRYVMTFAWFGMDGKAWYQQTQDERLLNEWLMRFLQYRSQWQQEGVMAMMRQLMHDYSVHQHIAHFTDFERQVTNLYHLIELLQDVALKERLGLLKSLYWLQTAIQESTDKIGDGSELRLESDEDAVKIVTIHSSKGLEYPIVFCPDLWNEGKKTKESIVVCHEDGALIADIGSNKMEQRHQQALLESQAEDLRLLYVAITRAQYRCYIVWANVRSSKAKNQSALAHLLRQQTGNDWDERLRNLANKKDGKLFSYQRLSSELEPLPPYQAQENNASLVARSFKGEFKLDWQMSSYSGLAYLSTHDIPEDLSNDKVQETYLEIKDPQNDTSVTDTEENTLPMLPKGAHTGNVVHDLLEHNSFSVLALQSAHKDETAYEHYLATQEKACLRYGLEPTENADLLNTLLQQTVTTALSPDDHNFTLANLNDHQCLKEMPFYFAVDQLNTLNINQALQGKEAFQPLTYKTIKGQLTGFIDLICEYQERYYVMDYKTNYLPEYSQQNMLHSMTEHNYGLQYWLYSVVLHRYLQQRLADYNFEQHFGGVRYLFVRGMQTNEPMSGVYYYQPDEATIEALAAALVG